MSKTDHRPLDSWSNCGTCAGMGWVCEEHPDRPWEHDGCGGAGAGRLCNPHLYVDFVAVLADNTGNEGRTGPTDGSSGDPAGRYLGRRKTND